MASVVGFCSSVYQSISWPAVTGFFGSTRMSAWFFHDATKWMGEVQPSWTREYINLSPVGRIAEGVEEFCDGPAELVEHAYHVCQSGGRFLLDGMAQMPANAYDVAKEALSFIASGANTLKLLHRVEAINLGANLNPIAAIGTSSSLIKATAQIVEHGAEYRAVAPRAGESAEAYERRVSITFLEVVKNVAMFAIKAFSLSGIVFGIAASSGLMLCLSTTLLTSFMAISFLKSAQGVGPHAAVVVNQDAAAV